ncbi:hypothetical protein RPA26_00735 [Staphylococcus haemolyticus]|uniref:dUTP diphosphatase n=2 Tax=Staphylococcus haemolyticus TaxID=1283 RepID=UPI0009B29D73|nr:hypothetical protein [Staphylococcus haemolyticus]MDT4199067.1 hypothetical protein [Staphylococcus haemolyticus]MDT4205665.1 hypothetical protein [Staphylococcus haemolyticus]MDT4236572.1 hypothetical protein [Staphylococcus haemolyticus]MDT4247851.1 hypothetical protein [Staphylococcus haemolyticus]MDT4251220.1 hypothetical protein [Staphylococcus haemolyticus]
MSILPIKLLSENAILPTRANPTDSGLDLYVAEDTTIPAHSTVVVPTHIAIDLAYGYEAQVRPRSGNSLKTKLRVALGNVYSFTKNIEKAIKTSYLDSAMDIAERCYGTVKEYRMKHEILEVVE